MSATIWEKVFSERCDMFIRVWRAISKEFDTINCNPIDGSFILGWQFEQESSQEQRQTNGDIEYAVLYFKPIIGQGLFVAFAATYELNSVSFLLKTW